MTDDAQRRQRERRVASRQAIGDVAANLPDAHPDAPLGCVRRESGKHRATDWRTRPRRRGESPGRWVCGLCHPPPVEDVERRAA